MFADGWMPIQQMDRSSATDDIACKVLAETCISSECLSGDEQWNKRRGENPRCDFENASYAADVRRRIKRGANLVVNVARLELFEGEQRGSKFLLHCVGSE